MSGFISYLSSFSLLFFASLRKAIYMFHHPLLSPAFLSSHLEKSSPNFLWNSSSCSSKVEGNFFKGWLSSIPSVFSQPTQISVLLSLLLTAESFGIMPLHLGHFFSFFALEEIIAFFGFFDPVWALPKALALVEVATLGFSSSSLRLVCPADC